MIPFLPGPSIDAIGETEIADARQFLALPVAEQVLWWASDGGWAFDVTTFAEYRWAMTELARGRDVSPPFSLLWFDRSDRSVREIIGGHWDTQDTRMKTVAQTETFTPLLERLMARRRFMPCGPTGEGVLAFAAKDVERAIEAGIKEAFRGQMNEEAGTKRAVAAAVATLALRESPT